MGTRILSDLQITGPSGSGKMSGFFSFTFGWNRVQRTRLISALIPRAEEIELVIM